MPVPKKYTARTTSLASPIGGWNARDSLAEMNPLDAVQLVNFFPLGRNVDEAIRMVDALQFFEDNGEVCPADWHKGDEGLKDTHDGVATYLAKH